MPSIVAQLERKREEARLGGGEKPYRRSARQGQVDSA